MFFTSILIFLIIGSLGFIVDIRKRREEQPQFVNSVLDSLNNISEKALKALISGKLDVLGTLMFKYYQELKKLNI